MKTLLWLLLLCLPVFAQTPPQASNEGYSRLVFDSVGNIDTANTQASGFSWYVGNWFGAPTTDASNITVTDGVLTLGNGTSGTLARLNSAIRGGSSYVGNAFGGGGYFEIEMSLNTQDSVNAAVYPAFFLEPVEHIGQNGSDQWPGQVAGYAHFGEIDIVEVNHVAFADRTGRNDYLASIIDWSGVFNAGYPYRIINVNNQAFTPFDVPINWSSRNKFAVLWVPQKGTVPGYLSYYFNDRLGFTLYYKGPVTVPPLPGQGTPNTITNYTPTTAAQAAQTYAVIDSEHFAMQIVTDPAWPITVYSVKVWQK